MRLDGSYVESGFYFDPRFHDRLVSLTLGPDIMAALSKLFPNLTSDFESL